jgi:hypothetical protein
MSPMLDGDPNTYVELACDGTNTVGVIGCGFTVFFTSKVNVRTVILMGGPILTNLKIKGGFYDDLTNSYT